MKKIFTKFVMAAAGLFLTAGVMAADYAPDLVWTGNALDSLWNKTSLNFKTFSGETPAAFSTGKKLLFSAGLDNFRDTVGTVTRNINRRHIRLKDTLEVGGMVFDSPNEYTLFSDEITGGFGYVIKGDFQLVQKGTGMLTLKGMNLKLDNKQGTLIQNGTIKVDGPKITNNQVAVTAFGPKVVLQNGHLLMGKGCNTTSTTTGYEQMKWDIDIPDNSFGTFTLDRYCTWEGKLTGSASTNFNINLRCVREVVGGDMSDFKGNINVGVDHSPEGPGNYIFYTAQSGFSCLAYVMADTFGIAEFAPGGKLANVYRRDNFKTLIDTSARIAQGYTYTTRYPLGTPDATINLKDSILMIWGSDLTLAAGASNMYRDNAVCRVGALNGTSMTILGSTRQGSGTTNHTWEIGALGTNSVFEGKIINSGFKSKSGLTNNINKVGKGDWRLTNAAHTFNGKVWVKEGSLTALGSFSTNGALVVDSGAVLKGTPNFSSVSSTTIDGTVEIGGEAEAHGLGSVTFGAGDVTFGKNAKIRIGLGQGSRCDKLNYFGLMKFDPEATIEFFVEEGPVVAGAQYQVIVPISTSSSASIETTAKVVCQDGLVLDYSKLFDDPIWSDNKAMCGVVTVISNTNPGVYQSEAAKVKSVNPVEKSAIGTSGTIVLTYDKDIKRGTGNITVGDKTFEPVISGATATINYSGISNASDSTDLVVPQGSILDLFSGTACKAFSARYFNDKVVPTLTAQSVKNDSIISWGDASMTFTFSEDVKVANTAAFTIGSRSQCEKVKPTASGKVVTVNYVALNFGKNYTIDIPAGAITDAVGNPAGAISVKFSTKPLPVFAADSTALNGKPSTTLPIVQDTIVNSGNVYPLWAQYSSGTSMYGSFANGEMTWNVNNSNNKIMAAFTGDAKSIYVTARRTGTGSVGLTIQESPAEASVAEWRTIQELTEDQLTTDKKEFGWNLSSGTRFIKIKPTVASTTNTLIISSYKVLTTPTSVEKPGIATFRYYNAEGGLVIDGLSGRTRIEVYNLAGMRTSTLTANSSSQFVPVSGFALVKVVSENQGTTVIKAMVK